MIKRLFYLFTSLLLLPGIAAACEVCNPGQAKFIRELTHGLSPRGPIDWFIVGFAALLLILTLIYSIKFLIRPGEENSDHIKRAILAFDNSDN